jgi:putative transposase
MITPLHDLPIIRQAKVLGISRGAFYYKARPVPPRDLGIMWRIDELHLERPFAGSRMLRDRLNREGVSIGRRHVASLMKRMGIAAIYRRPNTSKPAPGHKIYPYLLRGTKIDRPDQVWATDITYIPMARGFVYLVAIVDWFSRRVLAHRVSITMEADFCVDALEEAIGRHGKPGIFNSDQGSQFTSEAFTGVLLRNDVAISMDGKGAWRDNVFVERLWKSVKYEEVYLRAHDTVGEARAALGRYLDFYNRLRPHSPGVFQAHSWVRSAVACISIARTVTPSEDSWGDATVIYKGASSFLIWMMPGHMKLCCGSRRSVDPQNAWHL